MRNELLASYKLAIDTKDHDVINHFRKTRDRIGPAIVIEECCKVDKLQEEIEELKRLVQELLTDHIKTINLDMGGKHRYAISYNAYKVIEPLRQLVLKDKNTELEIRARFAKLNKDIDDLNLWDNWENDND